MQIKLPQIIFQTLTFVDLVGSAMLVDEQMFSLPLVLKIKILTVDYNIVLIDL